MIPCHTYHTFIAIVSWTNYYLFSLPSLAQSRVRTKQFKFGDGRHPGPHLYPDFCQEPFLIPVFSSTNFKVDIYHQSTSSPKGPPRITHLGFWGDASLGAGVTLLEEVYQLGMGFCQANPSGFHFLLPMDLDAELSNTMSARVCCHVPCHADSRLNL